MRLIKSANADPVSKDSIKQSGLKKTAKTKKKSCSLSSLVAQYADIRTSIQSINDLANDIANANIPYDEEISLESFKDLHLKHCQLHEKSNALLESLFDKLDEK